MVWFKNQQCIKSVRDVLQYRTHVHMPYFISQGRFGDCIRRNTHLKKIEFGYFEEAAEEIALTDYEGLWTRMAGNKSIETLEISSFHFDGNELPAMIPFIKNNHLISLGLGSGGGEVDLGERAGNNLAKMLESFNSLRQFECCGTRVSSDASREIIKALSGHRCLEKLTIFHVLQSTRESYEALAVLFQACNKLRALRIDSDGVGDTCAAIMAVALASTKSLRRLELNMSGFGEPGWFAICTLLGSKSTNISSVSIYGSWGGSQMSSAIMSSMVNNIAYSKKLNKLNLRGNRRVSLTGWKSLFDYVGDNSRCCLKNMIITDTNMSNQAMDMFTASLARNSSLNILDISDNDNVTTDGLRGFGAVFQSCNSVLKTIGISCLDDEVAILLASFLSGNSTLVAINCSWSGTDEHVLTRVGAKAFEDLLCNKTDIMATYSSNHTLRDISIWQSSGDISGLDRSLNFNRTYLPWHCARLKIMKCHFSGAEINLKPFFDMPVKVLPHSMSWISNAPGPSDDDMTDSTNLMYQLIKGMPSLLDLNGKGKRKRPSIACQT